KSSSAVTITAVLTFMCCSSEAGRVSGVGAAPTGFCAIIVSGVPDETVDAIGGASLTPLPPCCFRKIIPTANASTTRPIIGSAHGDCLRALAEACRWRFFLLIILNRGSYVGSDRCYAGK